MSNGIWKIDGVETKPKHKATITWEDTRFFSVTYQGKVYHGEVTEEQMELGYIKVKINHREFLLQKEGSLNSLIKELGLDKEKIKKLHQLKSPMPGRVIGIKVQIGDEIEVGDELLTLEAMKMENVLKSDGTGKVKSIDIALQEVVDKGKVLITFE
ncbi:MAG: acetyl-CoA carboxylase biotin carboxyl carrier protein subunit [Crocinitomicaceae bacterium]|nr:acetyl-CoA carboxylase biotin carboxyl carrier protein subunit [Crocinitomicaceae bacterium]